MDPLMWDPNISDLKDGAVGPSDEDRQPLVPEFAGLAHELIALHEARHGDHDARHGAQVAHAGSCPIANCPSKIWKFIDATGSARAATEGTVCCVSALPTSGSSGGNSPRRTTPPRRCRTSLSATTSATSRSNFALETAGSTSTYPAAPTFWLRKSVNPATMPS